MSFLEKVFSKRADEGVDIEEVLNNLDVEDETLYEDADAFVKPVTLNGPEDVTLIMNEAKQGNIVLLNIESLAKRNVLKLRDVVGALKSQIQEMDGDIARISHDRVLITPSKVKILKGKRAARVQA